MATRIIEYGNVPNTGAAYPVVPADHQIGSQSAMTASASSAQSSALNSETRVVLVQSDEAIKVALNANPTATDNDYKIVAGGEQYFAVQRGANWKVAIKT